MKIQNALVSNILDRSHRYFAHVTTVTLSWRVQNIVVIVRVYCTLECFEFSSNFEFDRNMLSGTGARLLTDTYFSSVFGIWCKFTLVSLKVFMLVWCHWNKYPHYWSCVRRIPCKAPVMCSVHVYFVVRLNMVWTDNRVVDDLRRHKFIQYRCNWLINFLWLQISRKSCIFVTYAGKSCEQMS